MKNVRDFYNKTAAVWAEKWYTDDSMMPLHRAFLLFLGKNPRVLDLCCGAGYESMRLAFLGAEVVGIDLSEESIHIARERNPGIPFHVGNMLDDYNYVGKVDGISCIAGIVHLPETQLRTAFERMSAVLEENGYVLLVIREGSGKLAQRSYTVIDGEEYDRDFYGHSLSELCSHAEGLFEFVEELLPDEESPWKNYLFKRA